MSANATTPAQPCVKHPGATETYPCGRCGNYFCAECCYSLPDGTVRCHECYARPAAPVAVAVAPASPAPLRVSFPSVTQYEPPTETVGPGQGCLQHPQVRGVYQCRFCGAKSCATCNFFFPPDLHVCPLCAASSSGALSPVRKKQMIGGLVSAGIGTALMAIAFGGALSGMEGRGHEIAAGVLFLLVLGAGAVGSGLDMAAFKKGRSNSIGIWLGLVWNFVLILGVMGLIFVGLFMKGE